jgi:hypothetical protein
MEQSDKDKAKMVEDQIISILKKYNAVIEVSYDWREIDIIVGIEVEDFKDFEDFVTWR